MKKRKYSAVLACGGLGTRLNKITGNVPKPLYEINGKSTLERSIEQLCENLIEKIFITISYKSYIFENFIKEIKKKYDIEIILFIEDRPLGECGALWHLKEELSHDFIFINGDLIFSMDLEKLFYFHTRLSSNITLVSHTCIHPEDSDLLAASNGSQVDNIFLKDSKINFNNNAYLGNSGIYVINKKILDILPAPSTDKIKSIFHYIVKNAFDLKIKMYSYNSTEYIKDMGTPKRLKAVENDLSKNIVFRQNYKNQQKVLFIDRDNTLIKCKIGDYILNKEFIIYLDENINKISLLAKKYNFVCLVTNQPSISMGKLTLPELDLINSKIVNYCLLKSLRIDVITFCPHHPHSGFLNEIPILKKDCFCRKPNPGMLLEQAFFRNIDLKNSLMIGDSENDLLAAKNSGCNFKNVNDL